MRSFPEISISPAFGFSVAILGLQQEYDEGLGRRHENSYTVHEQRELNHPVAFDPLLPFTAAQRRSLVGSEA